MMYRCPECGNTETLEVVAKVWVRLIQKGDDIETVEGGAICDHEWDSDSPMNCASCGHTAQSGMFYSGEEDE